MTIAPFSFPNVAVPLLCHVSLIINRLGAVAADPLEGSSPAAPGTRRRIVDSTLFLREAIVIPRRAGSVLSTATTIITDIIDRFVAL